MKYIYRSLIGVTFFIMLLLHCSVDKSSKICDIEGNIYHIVKIGDQLWTVENLNTSKFNDGTPIPFVSDNGTWSSMSTPAFCWYGNNTRYRKEYGALYNWHAISSGKLAIDGWRIPSASDWNNLWNYLSTKVAVYGPKAKALAAKSKWIKPRNPISFDDKMVGVLLANNNTTGFSALPGGYRNEIGGFINIGTVGSWWSSTECDSTLINYNVNKGLSYQEYLNSECKPNALYNAMCNDYDGRMNSFGNKKCGLSVRLVKDIE